MTLLQGSLLSRPQTREGELRFVLNCIPTAQQRPRHMRTKTGIDLTYKSEAQAANERTLEANLQPFVPLKPLSGALELKFTAVFPIPKSVNKRERQAMLAGEIGHTVKPDLDNLAKQLKDAMTRMRFWQDDKQVVRLVGDKRYGETPCWIVQVREIAAARQAQPYPRLRGVSEEFEENL